MKLSKLQLTFLERHGISKNEVFDASGLTRDEYQYQMKQGGFLVATGVTRCIKQNHALRNRSGHCVMCKPEVLAFQKRHTTQGDLYVLYSPKKRLIKVGVANSSAERLNTANIQSYGGIKDWKLMFSIRVENSGQAENLIHKKLEAYRRRRDFIKDGSTVSAQEIFSCSAKYAIDTINSMIE